jgi:arsenite-transporting ATPase
MRAVTRICKDALIGDEVFDTKRITQRESFEQNDRGYLMKLSIPFVEKSKVDLFQSENDVIIKINNFKRNIPLPNVLRTYRVSEAKLEEGILCLQFEKGEDEYE